MAFLHLSQRGRMKSKHSMQKCLFSKTLYLSPRSVTLQRLHIDPLQRMDVDEAPADDNAAAAVADCCCPCVGVDSMLPIIFGGQRTRGEAGGGVNGGTSPKSPTKRSRQVQTSAVMDCCAAG
uniref:Uncharacterized protein n=1 Tax=Romanomermis culicivorax TaxID=13658 RepID=A0A915KNI7_ROMCU